MNISEGRLFDFDNLIIEDGMFPGFIRPLQISEVALEPGGMIFEHRQCCHEITYIISGGGCFFTNNTPIPVRRGDIHVVAEGDRHKIIGNVNEKLRFICLGFKLRECPEEFREVCTFFERSPLCAANSEGDIRYVFDMLVNEFYDGKPKHDIAVESLMRLIIIKVFRLFSDKREVTARESGKNSVNKTVYGIVKYIDSNIYSVKTVKEVASALSYTENYISHVFKSKMGMTLLSYIKKKKLEAARVLIEHKNTELEEIAELLRFDSLSGMSRAFKAEYGKTPAQYMSEVIQEVKD